VRAIGVDDVFPATVCLPGPTPGKLELPPALTESLRESKARFPSSSPATRTGGQRRLSAFAKRNESSWRLVEIAAERSPHAQRREVVRAQCPPGVDDQPVLVVVVFYRPPPVVAAIMRPT